MGLLKEGIKKIHVDIPIDFGGGCSFEKAYVMAWLIKKFKLKTTCDIGIYRGRSFFPQALAHKFYSGGQVYGIDPYLKDESYQYDNEDISNELINFSNKTDFEKIFKQVQKYREDNFFEEYSEIIRKRSDQGINELKRKNVKLDLIHIDGNHDTELVLKDIALYSEILSRKGFIVLDDISWNSVKPAFKLLHNKMTKIIELQDSMNDFAVFSNTNSLQIRLIKIYFNIIHKKGLFKLFNPRYVKQILAKIIRKLKKKIK